VAEVPVEISGVLYDLPNKTTQRVVLIGKASIFGLSVGGGPVLPGDGGGDPPHIWGPTDPRPGQLPMPGGKPPSIWGPTDPRPGYGLPEVPELPEVPPGTPPNTVIKEAPEGGWGYFTNSQGAVYSAYNPGAAGPKR